MLVRWLFAWLHLLGLGVGLGAVAGPGAGAPRPPRHRRPATGLSCRCLVGCRGRDLDQYGARADDRWTRRRGPSTISGITSSGARWRSWSSSSCWERARGHAGAVEETGGERNRPDTAPAERFARISVAQAVLVVLMVLAATALARGIGMPASR